MPRRQPNLKHSNLTSVSREPVYPPCYYHQGGYSLEKEDVNEEKEEAPPIHLPREPVNMAVLGPKVGVMLMLWGCQCCSAAINDAVALPTSQHPVAVLLF